MINIYMPLGLQVRLDFLGEIFQIVAAHCVAEVSRSLLIALVSMQHLDQSSVANEIDVKLKRPWKTSARKSPSATVVFNANQHHPQAQAIDPRQANRFKIHS